PIHQPGPLEQIVVGGELVRNVLLVEQRREQHLGQIRRPEIVILNAGLADENLGNHQLNLQIEPGVLRGAPLTRQLPQRRENRVLGSRDQAARDDEHVHTALPARTGGSTNRPSNRAVQSSPASRAAGLMAPTRCPRSTHAARYAAFAWRTANRPIGPSWPNRRAYW